MRLSLDPEVEDFRAELNTFLDEHAPPEMLRGFDTMDTGAEDREQLIPEWSREWQATLFDHQWMIPAYPPDLGGRNATPVQQMVYFEELARLGVPRSCNPQGLSIITPSILDWGTEEQKARYALPTRLPVASGEPLGLDPFFESRVPGRGRASRRDLVAIAKAMVPSPTKQSAHGSRLPAVGRRLTAVTASSGSPACAAAPRSRR